MYLCLLFFMPVQSQAQNQPSAGMMRFPDISAEKIVFVYADDLWLVDREGGLATPLASPKGGERMPRFSPDGKSIAFTGNYDGGTDVYVIPTAGGIAKRMTYHPADEMVCDWSPDGKEILFASNELAGLARQPQLFTISEETPIPSKLPVPYGSNGAISADGTWLAYTPHSRDNRTWKRYRGGMASDIWLFNLKDNSAKKITDFEGTDTLPMWHGDNVYYLSDNGKEARLNIWKYDTKSAARQQITKFSEYDCKWPSIGPGKEGEGEIVFSNGPDLKVLNLKTGKSKSVAVTIPGDRPKLRAQKIDASEFITSGDISPSAKRICVEGRGDIWSLPAKEGPARNLTRTNGVAERSPSWSPDGRWIAYFSDESGEYELYITQSDGRGKTKQLTRNGNCFRYDPVWSPDSKHIVFTDKTGAIFLHTLDGDTRLVDTDPYANQADVHWSHESTWLTYAIASDDSSATSVVWIYNVPDGTKQQITSGFFNASSPVFDREGKFLYFASNQAFSDPKYEDVGSTFIYEDTELILAVPLRSDVKLPLQPKSDEQEWGDKKDKDKKENGDNKEDSDEADDDDKGAADHAGKDDSDSQESDQKDNDQDKGDTDADPVTGTWTVELKSEEMPAEQRSAVMKLELADDGSVTGSVDTPDGEHEFSAGSFDADSGTLKFELDTDNGKITVEATITDGKMKGIANVAGQEIPFEATRTQDEADSDAGKKGSKKPAEPFKIDFDGIRQRTFQLPITKGKFETLEVNDKNQLIYARVADGGSIKLFDMNDDKPEEKTVVSGTPNFDISADGKKLLVFREDKGYIVNAAAGQKLEDEIPTKGMLVMIDPREEWKQVFTDAWRIERDFFYDPNMHGVNWKKVRDEYSKMLDECTSRSDVGFVIGEMISELNVGHSYYRPGKTEEDAADDQKVGLLGCTFEAADGRYRIGTIFEGAEWDTDARNPLRAVDVKEGQYILEVNGLELTDETNPYSAFAGLADTVTYLTVSDDANLDDEDRRVIVKPMASDDDLRFRHWIETNRKRVEEKSNGRVGYIYVVNTGQPGQNDLFRQYYGQLAKEALIIDDRWNGGGQIPTRFIELMNRPVTNYWAKRDGRDWTWPQDAQHGPKCMLTNGMAGSGGDMFPALFRQAGLGKLIGMRTWGGLVGISGNPQMIDGSGVTAPTFAYYEKDGTWGIEGHGVDPDIVVVDDPAKMVDGGDPQLDRAIDHMLEELEKHPYKAPKRPKYPDRSKFGLEEADK
jgi:tricorn protease